jgi:hypothetical protein
MDAAKSRAATPKQTHHRVRWSPGLGGRLASVHPKRAAVMRVRCNRPKIPASIGYFDDGQRVSRAIKQVEGKRLEYRESVDNPRSWWPELN